MNVTEYKSVLVFLPAPNQQKSCPMRAVSTAATGYRSSSSMVTVNPMDTLQAYREYQAKRRLSTLSLFIGWTVMLLSKQETLFDEITKCENGSFEKFFLLLGFISTYLNSFHYQTHT